MSNTSENRVREEQVSRLNKDEDPRGRPHCDDVYPVTLRPKKAKTRDRTEEERLRIRSLTFHQASD